MAPRDAASALLHRLARYPADRYPAQHGIAQLELGVTLLGEERIAAAREALETAIRLIDRERMPVEHARARNVLGAALRAAGEPDAAAQAFTVAAEILGAEERPLERGAALFNLGLAELGTGHHEQAARSFERARELLDASAVPLQASAAAREHGNALLLTGRLEAAEAALREAKETAEQRADLASIGAAANGLGLVHLAGGRPREAVESFREAAGAHPPTVRPEGHAMAKANLALAHERLGEVARARLSARQALALGEAAPAVAQQATAVLDRLGEAVGDLLAVLDEESEDRWPAIVRDEAARWAQADHSEREAELRAWIEGQTARGERASRLAEALLGVLLEMPPPSMELMVRALLEALEGSDRAVAERFRSGTARTMAAFNPPQEGRLRECFSRIAREGGYNPEWS